MKLDRSGLLKEFINLHNLMLEDDSLIISLQADHDPTLIKDTSKV